jgi:large repetitive protein
MSPRTRRLDVEPLEIRAVPAGVITARLTAGILYLTGDAADNHVSIRIVNPANSYVELIPDAGTTINDLSTPGRGTPGETVLLNAQIFGLRAALGAGDDSVGLDPTNDFVLDRGAAINLGHGNNTLDLTTTGAVQLRWLRIAASEGFDDVHLTGDVFADAQLALGNGGSWITADNLLVEGRAGMTVRGGDGDDNLNLNDLVVLGPLTTRLGGGTGNPFDDQPDSGQHVHLTDSSVEGFIGSASSASVRLDDSPVFGPVSFSFAEGGRVTLADSRVVGDVMLSAAGPSNGLDLIAIGDTQVVGTVSVAGEGRAGLAVGPGTFRAEGVTVEAGARDAALSVLDGDLVVGRSTSPAFVYGNVAVSSDAGRASVSVSNGQLQALNLTLTSVAGSADFAQDAGAGTSVCQTQLIGALTVTADDLASFQLTGGSAFIDGPVTLTGADSARFQAAGVTTVAVGAVTVTGGETAAAFEFTGNDLSVSTRTVVTAKAVTNFLVRPTLFADFLGDVRIVGGTGRDHVETSAETRFDKNLTVILGGGEDVVVLSGAADRPTVGRAFVLSTGAGVDGVVLDGVWVEGRTILLTGTGADALTIRWGEYDGAFAADLGAGDDSIRLADEEIGVGVTFRGRAMIQAGAGHDSLRLGRPAVVAGDPDTPVVFEALGSRIDGGLGSNTFYNGEANYTGIAIGTGIVNWVLDGS